MSNTSNVPKTVTELQQHLYM